MAGHARAARRGSKDPSTRVGAVIYREDRRIASTGFNGLPKGIPDTDANLLDRERKYKRIIHAEVNAIDNATDSLVGCGIVVTAHPCSACALRLINRGISTIYFLGSGLENTDRWADDMALAAELCTEAGVSLIRLDEKTGSGD